jgi:hypothetical protein
LYLLAVTRLSAKVDNRVLGILKVVQGLPACLQITVANLYDQEMQRAIALPWVETSSDFPFLSFVHSN